MSDRERVMKELSWLIYNFPQQIDPKDAADKMCNAINTYCSDALSLLKEQEPRVLDWNEIGTVDGAVWLEDRDENEVVPGLVMQMHSAVNLDIKKDGKLHTASASRSDYGDRWRAWSARPTEEQRKAVKWNG